MRNLKKEHVHKCTWCGNIYDCTSMICNAPVGSVFAGLCKACQKEKDGWTKKGPSMRPEPHESETNE